MPKFLMKASYTVDGARGLVKEGGSGRREAIRKLLESVGGTLEAFYYAYGEDDAYLIVEVPSPQTALALSLRVNGSGAVRLSSVPLLTPEEMDEAVKQAVSYRAPGA